MLAASGCNKDRLDVEPVNEFLSSNFYITEEQVFSGLIAAYDPLGWSMAYGQWISYVMFGEIRSDNAHAGGDASNNDQPGWQEFDDFLNTNTNVVTQPLYRRNYIGIFRANLVIERPAAEIANTPLVQRYQAEARFLRAYYHFELFKHFGPIPVVTTALTPDDTDLGRNTVSEVFEAIVADLEDAIEAFRKDCYYQLPDVFPQDFWAALTPAERHMAWAVVLDLIAREAVPLRLTLCHFYGAPYFSLQ